MNLIQSKVVSAGLFFLVIFFFGYWLSRLGKPYNTVIFTLHKLIGLGAGIFLVIAVYRAHQAAPLSPVEMAAFGLTCILFIGTMAAGGLVSIFAAGGLAGLSQPTHVGIATAHKVFPYLTVISTAATLYLVG